MEHISTYGKHRECPHCDKRMSRYNPNRVCWAHTSLAHLYKPTVNTPRERNLDEAVQQWRTYFEMALDALDAESKIPERYREPRAAYWAAVRVRDEFALTWAEVSAIVSYPTSGESLKRLCYRFRTAGRYQHVTDLLV